MSHLLLTAPVAEPIDPPADKPWTQWSYLEAKHARYLAMMERTAPARIAGVMQLAEEINERWRNRTPEQVILDQCRRLIGEGRSDYQFDIGRAADEAGQTERDYGRGNV